MSARTESDCVCVRTSHSSDDSSLARIVHRGAISRKVVGGTALIRIVYGLSEELNVLRLFCISLHSTQTPQARHGVRFAKSLTLARAQSASGVTSRPQADSLSS